MKKLLVLLLFKIFLIGCSSSSTHNNHIVNGFGEVTFENGDRYLGMIKDGLPNGYGKTVTNDGAIYEGEHFNRTFHGSGKLILSDGSYFIGNMQNNKVNDGQMYLTDGRILNVND